MTVYLRRQVAVRAAKGIISSLPEGVVFPYRLTDVLPKYVLKLDNGAYSSDSIVLNSTDSFSVPLPANYSGSNQLACFIRATGRAKVVIIDPSALGTSTFLLKATSSAAQGDHKGIMMWQGQVTSITVSVPAAFTDDSVIDYFLWCIPDLTLADSWQTGIQALEVVP